jgi:hypothetical protein
MIEIAQVKLQLWKIQKYMFTLLQNYENIGNQCNLNNKISLLKTNKKVSWYQNESFI